MLAVVLMLASPAGAEIYSWVDEKGFRRFSNSPAEVPASASTAVETEPEPPPAFPGEVQPGSDAPPDGIGETAPARSEAGSGGNAKESARRRVESLADARRRWERQLVNREADLKRCEEDLSALRKRPFTNPAQHDQQVARHQRRITRAKQNCEEAREEIGAIDERLVKAQAAR
jgi:hypothetical protein